MLQIYLYGPNESGFLDLAPGTVLDIESLSEPFDEDLSTGEFSLPIDFPWTENNRRLTGFAERLENFGKKEKSWRVTVYNDLFPEVPSAMLTILEKSGSFSYQRGSFSATISGSKGIFGSLIKNKTLQDLKTGVITWKDMDSRSFAKAVMAGRYPQYPYMAFAPVAIEDFFPTGEGTGADTEFLARDTVNTIITSGFSGYVFGRPLSTNEGLPAPAGNPEYMNYRTVPFFNLKWVLKKSFEDFGFTVTGDFLDGTDFDDLYIFNQYGVENYAPTIAQDFNRSITPSNHLPKMLIADFIKSVLGLFNIYAGFTGVNQLQLHYRKKDLVNRKILSLNGICSSQFSSAYENAGSTENGYKLNYVVDSNDSYFGEQVKDVSDKTLMATVATVVGLATINAGRQLTTNDIAFVESENLYYVVADATASPVKWEVYAERLNAYVSGNGDRSVDCNISTLCTYVEENATTGLREKRNYVGCRQPGSYISNKGVKVVNDFGLRIFYIKKRSINNIEILVSFNHSRDVVNNKIVPYSLAWQGADGMAKSFHQVWQDMKENMQVVKTSIQTDQKVMQELKENNCYEIDNVLYLPYKTYPTIPLGKDMEIDLVAL